VTSEPTGAPPLGWALARFLLLIAVVAAAFAAVRWTPLGGYFEQQALADLLARLRAARWAPAALVGLYVAIGPLGIPVTPLVFAGGAVFGAAWGALWNWLGCVLSAAVSYAFARGLGRDFVARVTRGRLRRVERRLARTDFWALVAIRFVPLPFPLVNFGAALAGVPPGRFLAASAVGLAPSVGVYTLLATVLMRIAGGGEGGAAGAAAAGAIALLFLLTFLPRLWLARRRRRRYRELVAARRERGG
jgi:uncharacterized membrane protein YdjX (TVP38/TMEM64 family)